jgi:hypothetical protein
MIAHMSIGRVFGQFLKADAGCRDLVLGKPKVWGQFCHVPVIAQMQLGCGVKQHPSFKPCGKPWANE